MRSSLRCAIALAAAALLSAGANPARAQAAENRLLGINIWRSYRDVLAKYGQPDRIEVGAATTTAIGGGGGGGDMGGAMGGMTGGLPGMGGLGPMGGGAMGGSPYGSGGMTGMMGIMGRSTRGGMMGGGASGGAGMLPPPSGFGGGDGGGGGSPMMGTGGGGMGFSAGGTGETQVSEGEITWAYKRGSHEFFFLFNKDGRVIQIQSYGYKAGGVTRHGVGLGDPLRKIYTAYGWTPEIKKQGDNLTLDYSKDSHVAFQLTDRKTGQGYRVVGITVALTESGGFPTLPGGMGGGAGMEDMMGGGMRMPVGAGSGAGTGGGRLRGGVIDK